MEYSWDQPLCLIENTDNGLQIKDATLDKLALVKVPVSAVAIVGLYRTGKSYLMNLLGGSQTGMQTRIFVFFFVIMQTLCIW